MAKEGNCIRGNATGNESAGRLRRTGSDLFDHKLMQWSQLSQKRLDFVLLCWVTSKLSVRNELDLSVRKCMNSYTIPRLSVIGDENMKQVGVDTHCDVVLFITDGLLA